MAARRRRRRLKKQTRRQLQGSGAVVALAVVVWVAANWSTVWPVLVTVIAAAALGGGLALRQDIVALHRDLLGSWVKGAHLESLIPLNGSGGGTRRRPSA